MKLYEAIFLIPGSILTMLGLIFCDLVTCGIGVGLFLTGLWIGIKDEDKR